MKIAFFTHSAPGHLNPLTTLARRLRSRDHELVFISNLDSEPFIQAAGIPFVPVCDEALPVGSLLAMVEHMRKLSGAEALTALSTGVASFLREIFRDLPRVLADQKIEALVIDEGLYYTGMIPMAPNPYVSASTGLYYDLTGRTATSLYDWMTDKTPEAAERNRGGAESARKILAPWENVGRECANKIGLDIDWRDPFATHSRRAWITQLPRAFDFCDIAYPPQFHYTGPFLDGEGRRETTFPWDQLTGQPLVYASMGTLANGDDRIFSAIA
jgi:zeaxanthin glucosyltransferase